MAGSARVGSVPLRYSLRLLMPSSSGSSPARLVSLPSSDASAASPNSFTQLSGRPSLLSSASSLSPTPSPSVHCHNYLLAHLYPDLAEGIGVVRDSYRHHRQPVTISIIGFLALDPAGLGMSRLRIGNRITLIPWGFIPRPLGRKRVKETALLIPRFRGTRKSSVKREGLPRGSLFSIRRSIL